MVNTWNFPKEGTVILWQNYYRLGGEIRSRKPLGMEILDENLNEQYPAKHSFDVSKKDEEGFLAGGGGQCLRYTFETYWGKKTRLILAGENEATESQEGLGNEELVQQNG